uniref:Uncharacterized protein n=2 Tax=Hemiselmis andersenii TaxID=464988 RepID=A0A6U4MTQ1_HEMAN
MAKYVGAGGLANTFNGLLSGAVHGLLSDRRFAFESIYNGVFRSDELGWDIQKIPMQGFPSIGGAKKQDMVDWCYTIKSEPGIILSTLDPANGVDLPYATGPSVFYRTNCPLYKHWSRNPKLEGKFLELGLITKESKLPYSFQIAHHMTRFIAQPQDDVAKLVRETFENERTNGVALVGVQIRMGGAVIGDRVEFGPHDMKWNKHFLTCAQNVSKLIKDGRPVKYYISADRMDTHKLAADILGVENIVSQAKQPKHTDRGNHQRETAMLAALDSIYMGMYVEELVTTPGSTFGALAAIAMGRNPHHVEVDEGPKQFECRMTNLLNAPNRYRLPNSAPL